MKPPYLKPWTIIFVLSALLAAVFTACKNEVELPEPDYLGGDIDHARLHVTQKIGSVILTDRGAVIQSDSALWDEEDSIKTIVIPKTTTLESDIIDLSDYIGRRLEFSGYLCRGENKISINGEKQSVYLFYLLLADIHTSEGSRAGETSRQVICGTQFSDED